ncbi:MAG: hypothetical protein JWN53_1419, partial [Gemmatimonadetes bacterium]|nr:hypothetical protein [Gemmatimonadota bacterium]
MLCRVGTVRAFMLGGLLSALGLAACSDSTSTDLTQPAKLTLVSGDAQSGNGSALAAPLVVLVTDVQSHPIGGVTISWAASDPTATLSAATSTTNDQGQASVNWTLGASGSRQTVTATTAAIPGEHVVFQALGGGVLSGGVTVQSTPAVAFASVLSRMPSPAGSGALSSRIVTQPAASARQLAATAPPLRRLIVRFAPAATTLRIATAGSALQSNLRAMRQTMASHLASRRITAPELSPA